MFSISLVVLLIVAGGTVDIMRYYKDQTKAQSIADSTVLAAAAHINQN